MITLELIPQAIRPEATSPAAVSAHSALKVAQAIAKTYPAAPYAEVEAMAEEVITKALALPAVPIIAHGFIVRYLYEPITSQARPVDVFA